MKTELKLIAGVTGLISESRLSAMGFSRPAIARAKVSGLLQEVFGTVSTFKINKRKAATLLAEDDKLVDGDPVQYVKDGKVIKGRVVGQKNGRFSVAGSDSDKVVELDGKEVGKDEEEDGKPGAAPKPFGEAGHTFLKQPDGSFDIPALNPAVAYDSAGQRVGSPTLTTFPNEVVLIGGEGEESLVRATIHGKPAYVIVSDDGMFTDYPLYYPHNGEVRFDNPESFTPEFIQSVISYVQKNPLSESTSTASIPASPSLSGRLMGEKPAPKKTSRKRNGDMAAIVFSRTRKGGKTRTKVSGLKESDDDLCCLSSIPGLTLDRLRQLISAHPNELQLDMDDEDGLTFYYGNCMPTAVEEDGLAAIYCDPDDDAAEVDELYDFLVAALKPRKGGKARVKPGLKEAMAETGILDISAQMVDFDFEKISMRFPDFESFESYMRPDDFRLLLERKWAAYSIDESACVVYSAKGLAEVRAVLGEAGLGEAGGRVNPYLKAAEDAMDASFLEVSVNGEPIFDLQVEDPASVDKVRESIRDLLIKFAENNPLIIDSTSLR